jgi:hypothetical protein
MRDCICDCDKRPTLIRLIWIRIIKTMASLQTEPVARVRPVIYRGIYLYPLIVGWSALRIYCRKADVDQRQLGVV